MGNWQKRYLGTICQLAYGKNLATSLFTSDGYKVFGANSVIGFYTKYTHEDEEVLVSSRGEYSGVINFSEPKSFITNNSIVCRLRLDLDKRFLFYALRNIPRQSFVSGSAQPQVVIQDLEKVEVYYPEHKPEQTRIAQILFIADKAIAKTEALIAKYQRIKTGLMQDLLTRGIDEHGNIRSEQTHKFKTKKGLRVPEEWEVDSLEKFCFIHNYLRKPISSLERFEKKGVYPYYGATGIIDYIDEYRVEGKFVLIGEDGDHFLKYEKQNMTHLVDGKFNVSNHAHILSGKENCLTEWIHYFFCNRDITYYLTRQGAGRFKLNKATLINLPMWVPMNMEEQKRIIEKIFVFENQFQNILTYREKLISLKTGLMQDLLSGKVKVKVEQCTVDKS